MLAGSMLPEMLGNGWIYIDKQPYIKEDTLPFLSNSQLGECTRPVHLLSVACGFSAYGILLVLGKTGRTWTSRGEGCSFDKTNTYQRINMPTMDATNGWQLKESRSS